MWVWQVKYGITAVYNKYTIIAPLIYTYVGIVLTAS